MPSDTEKPGNQGNIREFGSALENSGKTQGKLAFFEVSGKMKKKIRENLEKLTFLYFFNTFLALFLSNKIINIEK